MYNGKKSNGIKEILAERISLWRALLAMSNQPAGRGPLAKERVALEMEAFLDGLKIGQMEIIDRESLASFKLLDKKGKEV